MMSKDKKYLELSRAHTQQTCGGKKGSKQSPPALKHDDAPASQIGTVFPIAKDMDWSAGSILRTCTFRPTSSPLSFPCVVATKNFLTLPLCDQMHRVPIAITKQSPAL